jgi:glutaredoxin
MDKELIMYGRSYGCLYITIAKKVLEEKGVPYHEIHINEDQEARQRVIDWTGFRSVPTLVVANPGEIIPFEPPESLARGKSPRGIDRGTMITEPDDIQLESWLRKHGMIDD